MTFYLREKIFTNTESLFVFCFFYLMHVDHLFIYLFLQTTRRIYSGVLFLAISFSPVSSLALRTGGRS